MGNEGSRRFGEDEMPVKERKWDLGMAVNELSQGRQGGSIWV